MAIQQQLIDRIVSLAIEISLRQTAVVDVKYNGIANQLSVRICRSSAARKPPEYVDLAEPTDSEIRRQRINQRLLELVTSLESIKLRSCNRENAWKYRSDS